MSKITKKVWLYAYTKAPSYAVLRNARSHSISE
jgi:hypothetical protein